MKPSAGGGDRAGLAWVAAHRAVHRRSLPEGPGPLHRLGWAAGIIPGEEKPWSRLGILETPKGWSFGDRDSSIQQSGGDCGVSLCLPTRDALVNKAGPRTAAADLGNVKPQPAALSFARPHGARMRRLSWGRSSVVLRTQARRCPARCEPHPGAAGSMRGCAGGGMGCRMGEGRRRGWCANPFSGGCHRAWLQTRTGGPSRSVSREHVHPHSPGPICWVPGPPPNARAPVLSMSPWCRSALQACLGTVYLSHPGSPGPAQV